MAKAKVKRTVAEQCAQAYKALLSQANPNTLLVAESMNVVTGIKIPFALEYFFNCNILPLGVVIELSGESGSNKTTFAYEIGRMIRSLDGWTEMFLTEGKISPDLIGSIMGYAEEYISQGKHSPFLCHESTNMESWQSASLQRINQAMALFNKGSKSFDVIKGARCPIHYVVDSIMGQNLLETDTNVAEDGATGRRFATEAASLTTYLKTMQSLVSQGPFLLTLINHAKPSTTQVRRGPYDKQEYSSPGGKQVRFQSTYRIMLFKTKKMLEIEDETTRSLFRKGYTIRMELTKSSLGEDQTNLNVQYVWRYLPCPITGKVRQRGEFRWNAAIVGLLMKEIEKIDAVGAKKLALEKLDSIVHFRFLSGDKYTSKTFDVGSANPISANDLGALIQNDPAIVEGLRDFFGIKRYNVWDQRESFFKLRTDLQSKVHASLSSIPNAIS